MTPLSLTASAFEISQKIDAERQTERKKDRHEEEMMNDNIIVQGFHLVLLKVICFRERVNISYRKNNW